MTIPIASRRLLTVLLGLAVMTVAAGCELEEIALDQLNVSANVDMANPDASETVKLDIPFSGQRLVVHNPIGEIEIKTTEDPGYVAVRPKIRVDAAKNVKAMELDDLQIKTSSTSDEIRIRVTTAIDSVRNAPDRNWQQLDGRPVGWVDFQIQLPQEAAVNLKQNLGSIVVNDFRGDLTATTNVGGIEVRNADTTSLSLRSEVGTLAVVESSVGNELALHSSAGQARVADVQFGQAEINTQAGEVNVKDVQGQSLDVSTQLGEIDVIRADVRELDLSSQMGEIDLQANRVFQADVRNQWGEIEVRLPSGNVPRIRASTQAGRVDVLRLPQPYRSSLQRGGSWLGESIDLNPSGAQAMLNLKTQLGDIQIVFPDTASQ
ncbi:MAG: DUF4097 family beta strand repeat-containing protein [Candidatus Bipolaricaulia bacterium]